MSELILERRAALLRHIHNVQESCLLLGDRLIKHGEEKTGHDLISHGMIHDNSKFHGIEWDYLHSDLFGGEHQDKLAMAIHQHVTTNPHHPEYWGHRYSSDDGIHAMPRVYVAEMVCDWAGRSKEFGNDLREWIKTTATKKFKMAPQSRVYKEIKDFTSILLDPAFKPVVESKKGSS